MNIGELSISSAKKKAAVMLAYANGAKVEYFDRGGCEWNPISLPAWNWEAGDYRVRKEPRRLWQTITPNGTIAYNGNEKPRELTEGEKARGFVRVEYVEAMKEGNQ